MAGSPFLVSDDDLHRWLEEDAPYGDLTTYALGISDRPARIGFAPRRAGTVACAEEAARMLELQGARVLRLVGSGSTVAPGEPVLVAEGTAGALHMAWKPTQTMLEYTLAVATRTKAIVDAARRGNPLATVVCTRKTIPGTRALAVKAVLAGGGMPHRLGVSDSLLVFAQHRVFLRGDVAAGLAALSRRLPERRVTIEVDSVAEAEALLDPLCTAGALPGVVQLDKGGPSEIKALRALVDRLAPPDEAGGLAAARPVVAAAGGINADNATEYAAAGADVLVTSAPYYAPPLDVAVQITPTNG